MRPLGLPQLLEAFEAQGARPTAAGLTDDVEQIARFLGYEARPPPKPTKRAEPGPKGLDPDPDDVDRERPPEPSVVRAVASVPFLQPLEWSENTRDVSPSLRPDPGVSPLPARGTTLVGGKGPPTPSIYRPEQLATAVGALLVTRAPRGGPDLAWLVERVATGEVVTRIRRRMVPRPVSSLNLVVELHPDAAPAWTDALAVQRALTRLRPTGGVAQYQVGALPRVVRGQRTLYVTDAGALDADDDPLCGRRAAWHQLIRARRLAGEEPLLWALAPVDGFDASALADWSRISAPRVAHRPADPAVLDQLLALASLALQVDAPLLRELRTLVSKDPRLELEAWRRRDVFVRGTNWAAWRAIPFKTNRARLVEASKPGTWLTSDRLQSALRIIAKYRWENRSETRAYRVDESLWHDEVASWRVLYRQLSSPLSEALSAMPEAHNWIDDNDRYLERIVGTAHETAPDVVPIRRLRAWLAEARRFEAAEAFQSGGVLYRAAQAVDARDDALLRLSFAQGPQGLSVRPQGLVPGGSWVAAVDAGVPEAYLEADPDVRVRMGQPVALPVLARYARPFGVEVPPWAHRAGEDEYGRWTEVDVEGVTFRMRWIAPGTFLMGSPEGEVGRFENEGPRHQVTLSEGYWLAETPCTQALFEAVLARNPVTGEAVGATKPVENVIWIDVQDFLEAVNARVPRLGLALPTEAQWEYACRAGTQTATYAGDLAPGSEAGGSETLEPIAWYDGNSRSLRPVKEKQPNAWGLFDTLGNVNEWCLDGKRDYDIAAVSDPVGPMDEGRYRVIRGGSWISVARDCRAAYRVADHPSSRFDLLGFRFVRGQAAPGGSPEGSAGGQGLGDGRSPSGAVPGPRDGQSEAPAVITSRGHGARPEWADHVGDDQFGRFADVVLRGQRRSALDVSFRMRPIPAGTFMMGSPEDEDGRYDDEGPQHSVTLSRGFWTADTPCTQALYEAVMETNPSGFKGPDRPVEQVSWKDTTVFLQRFNERVLGINLALPTEAQWEYACRAGSSAARYGKLDQIAWHDRNSKSQTQPVRGKAPNAWGLYDMLGNVREWCQDGLRNYGSEAVVDPTGPSGDSRVIRGGSWDFTARVCRAASRRAYHPSLRLHYLGFRFVRGQAAPGGRPEGSEEGPEGLIKNEDGARAERGPVWSGETTTALSTPHLILKTDRTNLAIGVVERPAWADDMGRDPYGLFVDASVPAKRKSMIDVPFRMRWIPPGRFLMGSPEEEPGRFNNESLHQVTLTEGFWMAETACTQALWTAVMSDNPSEFPSPDRPVEKVSWDDIQSFFEQLRTLKPGLDMALPTEAMWEYACRAGTSTATYAGDLVITGERNAAVLDAIAWYGGNSGVDFDLDEGADSSDWDEKQYPHTTAGTRWVRRKQPNPWGLFDMLGNVLEWCTDSVELGDDYWPVDLGDQPQVDPVANRGDDRVFRGGSWFSTARRCRAAFRGASHPSGRFDDLGFRFVRGQAAPGGGPEGLLERAEPDLEEARGAGRASSPEPTLWQRARRLFSGKDDDSE